MTVGSVWFSSILKENFHVHVLILALEENTSSYEDYDLLYSEVAEKCGIKRS